MAGLEEKLFKPFTKYKNESNKLCSTVKRKQFYYKAAIVNPNIMIRNCIAGESPETLLHMYPLQHQTSHDSVRAPTVLLFFLSQYLSSFTQVLLFAHRFSINFLPSCSKVIVKQKL